MDIHHLESTKLSTNYVFLTVNCDKLYIKEHCKNIKDFLKVTFLLNAKFKQQSSH